jgi:hypothetical protein
LFQEFFFGFLFSASGGGGPEYYPETHRAENQSENYSDNRIVDRIVDFPVPVFPRVINGKDSKCGEWNSENAKHNLADHKANFGQRFVFRTVAV